MSLKIYTATEQQAYLKHGNNDVLFGIQIARDFKLLPIKGAYYSGSNTTITEVKLVKLNRHTLNEEYETIVSSSVIIYDTDQFKVDPSVNLGVTLDECIYYLEFKTSENIYKSEVFLCKQFPVGLTADSTYWTADSTIITADQTKITI